MFPSSVSKQPILYLTNTVYCIISLLLMRAEIVRAQGRVDIIRSFDTAFIAGLQRQVDTTKDFDASVSIYQKMLTASIRTKYPDGAASALLGIGLRYLNKGEFERSITFFNESLPYCRKSIYDKSMLSLYYNDMALPYWYMGEYVVAAQNFHLALKELEKLGNNTESTSALIYNNLATIQMKLNQYPQAFIYLTKGEQIARKGNLKYYLAMLLGNKGDYFFGMNLPDSAENYYTQSLSLAKELKNRFFEAALNISIGDVCVASNQSKQAISYYKAAIAIASMARSPQYVIGGYYSLGGALINLRRYKDAESALTVGLQEAKKIHYKDDLIRANTLLANVYKATHQYAKASAVQDTLLMLKDSLFSMEKTKAINNLEVKYRTAEKDKQLAVSSLQLAKQERDLAKKEKELAKKNLWIGGISAGTVILCLLLIALYRAKQHEKSIQRSQLKSLQQEQEISILRAMREGEELERGHIARELHDGIGGILSAAMLRFSAIKQQHQELAETQEYHEVMGLLDEMGNEIRKTSHHLMPEVLLKNSLPGAVQSYCDHVSKGRGLELDVQCYGNFDRLHQEFKLGIYRMVQELVQNIIKHAKAKYALVQLLKDDKLLSVTIEDDGVGFEPGETRNGIGLHNLQTRVQNLNGHFTLESEEGKGTAVYIEFNLVNEEISAVEGDI